MDLSDKNDENGFTLVLGGNFNGKFEFHTKDYIGGGKFGHIFKGQCHGFS